MIKLKNVTKIFHQDKQQIIALDDISLDVAPGKIFGVIGESGAGKSTLIRCINLLERPTYGEVIVAEKNLLQLSPKQLRLARKDISMIFQHFNLLSQRTVFENIAFPLKLTGTTSKDIRSRVSHLLELVGLSDKEHCYPSSLSGGQKQRVAIARALATHPKVLLCDEATSALDPATTQSILDLLKNINHQLGLTILLITHEMAVVKNICDQAAIISGGKLIEQNTVGAIFSSPKTELAQKFIQSTRHLTLPDDYKKRLKPVYIENSHALLSLEFTGQSVDSPIISEISSHFNVSISILSAQIDYSGGVKFGVMLVELFTSFTKVQPIVDYLLEKQVKVEVLGYV